MNRKIFSLIFCLILSFSIRGGAQILEIDPEKINETLERPERIGMSLSGSTGLVTIPTPNFRSVTKASVSFKGDISRHSSTLATSTYNVFKLERYVSLSYFITKNLELSLNHLRFDRSSSPYLAELNYTEDPTGFGLKYSTHSGQKDFCFGFNFAPLSAAELNRTDLTQIENLRSVYFSTSETISKTLEGYLSLKESFTEKQKILFSDGSEFRVNRKEFLIGSLGLEYSPSNVLSLFLETQFFNYRDFYRKNSDRHSFNAGIRIGKEPFQLELLGVSLSVNPRALLGATIGF